MTDNRHKRSSDTSLAEQVYRQLLEDLSEGRWPPDTTLSAYALADQLSVSRTPVVEALKRLEADGLVEILPRVGVRVTRTSHQERDELFAIATALAGLAAERAAQRTDTEWLDRLDELVDGLSAAADRGEAAEFNRCARQFHDVLIRTGLPARTSAAEQMWRSLRAQIGRDLGVGVRPGYIPELQAIADALRARSPLRARAAAARHLTSLYTDANRSRPDPAMPNNDHGGLEHAALLYRSTAELIASASPYALAGLQRGERVLIVSTPENLEALGAALGSDGTKVDYRDSAQWYDDPASALRRYREYIDEHGASGRVRIIGEPRWSAHSAEAVEAWLRYESVINVALERAPASIACPYDADRLPARVINGAREAHPGLCESGKIARSPSYREFFSGSARRS